MKDPDLLDHLDTSLQAKQSSLLFPIEESAKEQIKPGRRQEDKFEEMAQQAVDHSAIAEKAYVPLDAADIVAIYKDCLTESQFI